MKTVIREVVLVMALALLASGVTWLIVGSPNRSVPCVPEDLDEGWICLDDLEAGGERILWVDARPRVEWQRNGLMGSILLTDHNAEDWDDLVAEAAEQLFGAPRVVIYCNDVGCGSSQAVAEKLRELQLADRIEVLYGGWKALRAGGMLDQP